MKMANTLCVVKLIVFDVDGVEEPIEDKIADCPEVFDASSTHML